MKKNILILRIVFVMLILTAFGFISWMTPKTNQLNTTNNKHEIITVDDQYKSMETIINDSLIPNFFYSIDTRFNSVKKELGSTNLIPYLIVVPKTQAVYIQGNDALINYLRENSKDEVAFIQGQELRSGKIHFTVTKNGMLSNIEIKATSAYPFVDKRIVELIKKTSGDWNPALSSSGEKIDQEFVISFGSMGC